MSVSALPSGFSYEAVERIVHPSIVLARKCGDKFGKYIDQQQKGIEVLHYVMNDVPTTGALQHIFLQRSIPEYEEDLYCDLMVIILNARIGLHTVERTAYIYQPEDDFHEESWYLRLPRGEGPDSLITLTNAEIRQLIDLVEPIQPYEEGSDKLDT